LEKNHGPHFYAGSLENQFILIEDLGLSHPSLVGPLTRSSSAVNIKEAEQTLINYVRRVGKMHADTVGKSAQFTSILKRIYPQALHFIHLPETEGTKILTQFKRLTGDESKELSHEVHSIFEFTQSSQEFNVLLHGDICPDNVYSQSNQIRLIDFEFCDFGNALIDGVYLRMHMPSCWCSKAVPESILYKMESAYRAELKTGISAAADDDIYNKQLVYSCAYWLIRTLKQLDEMDLINHEWICPSGPVDIDSKWDPDKNAFRPRILSRIEAFISCAKTTEHFLKLSEASMHLLSHLRKIWPEVQNIDVYPVFK
jgi:hypothetical protein